MCGHTICEEFNWIMKTLQVKLFSLIQVFIFALHCFMNSDNAGQQGYGT